MNKPADPITLLSPLDRPAPEALRDRVILVSGAGGAIGRAVSRALAGLGATLVLLGPEPEALTHLHDEIVADGGIPPILQAIDYRGATVQDYDELGAALDSQFGRLDGLLHNAGVLGYHGPILNHPPEAWYEVIQVNLQAAFALTRACLEPLIRSDDAPVIFTTCEWVRQPRAFSAAYGVAYAGTEMLMRILADEMEFKPNLRFNALDPGWVASPITETLFPGRETSHWTSPDAVVGAYLYLLGPESRGITGRVFGIAPAADEHSPPPEKP